MDQVFRGRQYEGEIELTKVTYKNDFKLIPKDEEEAYLRGVLPPEELKKSVLPEYMEFPPLLRVSKYLKSYFLTIIIVSF